MSKTQRRGSNRDDRTTSKSKGIRVGGTAGHVLSGMCVLCVYMLGVTAWADSVRWSNKGHLLAFIYRRVL